MLHVCALKLSLLQLPLDKEVCVDSQLLFSCIVLLQWLVNCGFEDELLSLECLQKFFQRSMFYDAATSISFPLVKYISIYSMLFQNHDDHDSFISHYTLQCLQLHCCKSQELISLCFQHANGLRKQLSNYSANLKTSSVFEIQ